MIPYPLIGMLYFQIPFIFLGLILGGWQYIMISLSVFGVHLIIRTILNKIDSNLPPEERHKARRFDYPLSSGEGYKIKIDFLSCFLLSFALGFFISGYVGLFELGLVNIVEEHVIKLFGWMLYIAGLMTVPMFIIMSLARIYVEKGYDKKERVDNPFLRSLLILLVVFAIVFQIWVLLNLKQLMTIDVTTYLHYTTVIKILFGIPSIWLITMLFFGLTGEEYKAVF